MNPRFQNLRIAGFNGISIRNIPHKLVDGWPACVYPKKVAKKEATGFDSPIRQRRTSATRRYFFVRTITSPMSGSGGEASACRFPLSPVCQPRHLLLTPFDSGLRGFTTDKEAIMPGITTPQHSRSEQIHRLAGIADTIGAMLGVFALLPADGQEDALTVSASLADELAKALAAIVGGAA